MSLKDRIKQIIKLALSFLLYYSGIVSLCRSLKMKNKAVILMYHRVVDTLNAQIDYSPNGMIVDKRTFSRHMEYLIENYNVISLDELLGLLKKEDELPSNLCVITFDDGWKDTYDNAYPILVKYDLPATVFLTTSYLEGKIPFWEENIKYLISNIYCLIQNNNLEDKEPILIKIRDLGIEDLLLIKRKYFSASLMKYVKSLRDKPEEFKINIINEIENLLGAYGYLTERLFLTYSEIKKWLKINLTSEPTLHLITI